MQKAGATMKPRRSTRIREIAARQKVEEAERAAKLEIESTMPEQPANFDTEEEKAGRDNTSDRPGSVAKTEAGIEGEIDLSAELGSPKKKQKTTPQPNEASAEF